jgi:hypothetical protein
LHDCRKCLPREYSDDVAVKAAFSSSAKERPLPNLQISPSFCQLRIVALLLAAVGLSLAAAGASPSAAYAGATGFLCPSSGRLISVGARTDEVRKKCREPDDIQKRTELRTVRETRRRWTNGVAEDVVVEQTVEIPIEEWFYDFGPARFTKTLRFETGRLVFVEEGAKGTPGGN